MCGVCCVAVVGCADFAVWERRVGMVCVVCVDLVVGLSFVVGVS